MTDLAHIDRALSEIGVAPANVGDLVTRYGERDRSLARVDDVLRALGAGVTPIESPKPTATRSVPAPAASPSSRPRRNLLDEELDPNEFPQTVPPPAPVAEPTLAAREDATEDGFELLVEDEDILEIDDDDDVQGSDEQG
jgi:hypothetical protein